MFWFYFFFLRFHFFWDFIFFDIFLIWKKIKEMTLTLTSSWRYLTLTLSDTHIDWVLNLFIYLFIFFFWSIIYFDIFLIWKKIKEMTLTLTTFWHYLTLSLTWSWNYLTLTLSDTDIDWVWKFLSSENFLISSFLRFHFFGVFIFLGFFSEIWKKIKETDKNLNKKIYCSLSKQWSIHQQLLSYCIATSKIYEKIGFKAKSSDLGKCLFKSASGLFTQ